MPEDPFEFQVNGYRAMSAERKLEIAFGLRAFALETKLASLRRQHPTLSDEALRAQLRDLLATDRA